MEPRPGRTDAHDYRKIEGRPDRDVGPGRVRAGAVVHVHLHLVATGAGDDVRMAVAVEVAQGDRQDVRTGPEAIGRERHRVDAVFEAFGGECGPAGPM